MTDVTTLDMIIKNQDAMTEEFKLYRVMFNELKESIVEQRLQNKSILKALDNLIVNIKQDEIENRNVVLKIDSRVLELEKWRMSLDLFYADLKGRSIIITSIVAFGFTIVWYVADKLIDVYTKIHTP